MKKTIILAADHGGYELKNLLKDYVSELGYEIVDLGVNSSESVDYPDYANKMADYMLKNPSYIGILVCGTGIGISIAANRHKHIRCALLHNELEAKMAKEHNNANVIAFGGRVLDKEQAKKCVKEFLSSEFEGGRHQKRINKIL